MHIAYYLLRDDGDGELFVALPVDDDFFSYPESSKKLQSIIEQELNKIGDWIMIDNTECDFPDVLDLSPPSDGEDIFPRWYLSAMVFPV